MGQLRARQDEEILGLRLANAHLHEIIRMQDQFYGLFIQALGEGNDGAVARCTAAIPTFNHVLAERLRRATRATTSRGKL